MDDYSTHSPGAIKGLREWFRKIKTYDGKEQNGLGYEGGIMSVERTIEIISERQEFYRKLKEGKS